MFKKHLHSVYRKYNDENKTEFDFCLTQNERNLKIEDNLFNSFLTSIEQEDIRFYPSLNSLKSKLAKSLEVSTDNILLTPGSDTAIKTLFEAIDFGDGHFITTDYHFPMYSVYGSLYNIPVTFVNYNSNLTYSIADIISSITNETKLVILSNPNSPLGDYKSFTELKPLFETGIPILIDEAYIELTSNSSLLKYIHNYSNLFITRTFSKGLGAAGTRVGYIVSDSKNIEVLNKFRFMYEIPGVSAKYVEMILDQKEYFTQYCQSTLAEKTQLVEILKKNKMLEIIDTDSSWFFIKSTPRLIKLFDQYKVGVRTVILPGQAEEYMKFNYDPVLKGSEFLKKLSNENFN